MDLAERLSSIKPSATLAISAKAKAMRAQGLDVVSLAAGEPDFPTPEFICRAAIQAIKDGHHGYTAADGMPELKQAVRAKYQRETGLDYTPDQVVVTCGGKHAIYGLAQATLNPGDEVIIPAPYWVSYPSIVILAGARPVFVPTDRATGFKMTPDQFKAALTDKTRALIFNSPSNPTGAVYTREEMLALAEVALEREILIWSDEIYEKLVFGGREFHCLAGLREELKERVVTLNGVAKTYAMTGWRIGFLAGPEKIARGVARIQSQSTSNPATPSQFAALAALNGPPEPVEEMRQAFDRRRVLILDLLKSLKVKVDPPWGAFYILPDFSAYLKGRIRDSAALASYLLDQAKVATVPGVAFGAEGHLRFSYATSEAQIREAVSRLAEALDKLD